jgi:hypothetical protein
MLIKRYGFSWTTLLMPNNVVALQPFIWQTLYALGLLNLEKYMNALITKKHLSRDSTVRISLRVLVD